MTRKMKNLRVLAEDFLELIRGSGPQEPGVNPADPLQRLPQIELFPVEIEF